jgi:hypothetical protein
VKQAIADIAGRKGVLAKSQRTRSRVAKIPRSARRHWVFSEAWFRASRYTPAKKRFDISFVGDIAQMIVVAHPERELEVGRYESSVKVVAEESYGRYHNIELKRIFTKYR